MPITHAVHLAVIFFSRASSPHKLPILLLHPTYQVQCDFPERESKLCAQGVFATDREGARWLRSKRPRNGNAITPTLTRGTRISGRLTLVPPLAGWSFLKWCIGCIACSPRLLQIAVTLTSVTSLDLKGHTVGGLSAECLYAKISRTNYT